MKDLTGMRFGRLTVIGFDCKQKHDDYTSYYWKCQCDCGEIAYVNANSLLYGNTRSCGCLRREVQQKMASERAKNRTIKITLNGETHTMDEWSKITGISKNTIYRRYTYHHTPEEILSKEKLTHRKREYCRWRDDQRRSMTYNGETHTLTEWAKITGIPYPTIYSREKRGKSPEVVLQKRPIMIELTYNGETHTLMEWSKITGISYCTLYRRYSRGWNAKKVLDKT